MVLVLTNSLDATATFLIPILEDAGVGTLRLNTDELVPRLIGTYKHSRPELKLDNRVLQADEIQHIWYRRPERLTASFFDGSPEGNYARLEWTEFVECFLAHIPIHKWMNHPARNTGASRKLEQLTIASKLGFIIPDTLVTQDEVELRKFFERHSGKIIAKPMSTGYVERPYEDCDTLIYTNQVAESHLKDLSDLKNCPTLFQQFIRKSSDVRITIVDNDVHAVELYAAESSGEQRCDIRRNNMEDVVYRPITLPSAIERKILQFVRHYGLRFGAIDMAVTNDGEWIFFEINPNGQWAWLDIAAGTSISDSFARSFGAPLFTRN